MRMAPLKQLLLILWKIVKKIAVLGDLLSDILEVLRANGETRSWLIDLVLSCKYKSC